MGKLDEWAGQTEEQIKLLNGTKRDFQSTLGTFKFAVVRQHSHPCQFKLPWCSLCLASTAMQSHWNGNKSTHSEPPNLGLPIVDMRPLTCADDSPRGTIVDHLTCWLLRAWSSLKIAGRTVLNFDTLLWMVRCTPDIAPEIGWSCPVISRGTFFQCLSCRMRPKIIQEKKLRVTS